MEGQRAPLCVVRPGDRRIPARRALVAVETLEGRSLLASLTVVAPGGISGIASVGGQVEKNFARLGTQAISAGSPSSPDFFVLAGGPASIGPGGAGSDASVNYSVSPAQPSSSILRLEFISGATSIPPSGQTTGQSALLQIGTSLGSNPGDFIAIAITPQGNEHIGDPVVVNIGGAFKALGDGLDWSTSFNIEYDLGAGPKTVLSGDLVAPTATWYTKTNGVSFTAAIGQSIRMRFDANSQAQASDGASNPSWIYQDLGLVFSCTDEPCVMPRFVGSWRPAEQAELSGLLQSAPSDQLRQWMLCDLTYNRRAGGISPITSLTPSSLGVYDPFFKLQPAAQKSYLGFEAGKSFWLSMSPHDQGRYSDFVDGLNPGEKAAFAAMKQGAGASSLANVNDPDAPSQFGYRFRIVLFNIQPPQHAPPGYNAKEWLTIRRNWSSASHKFLAFLNTLPLLGGTGP